MERVGGMAIVKKRRNWIARKRFYHDTCFVYASIHEWSWFGFQKQFSMDGVLINFFGIGLFIGNEFWWRLTRVYRK